MEASEWVVTIRRGVNELDGDVLAAAFGLIERTKGEWQLFPAFASKGHGGLGEIAIHADMLGGSEDEWFKMTHEYASTLVSLHMHDYVESYRHLSLAFTRLLSLFASESTAWMMPLLHQTIFDASAVASLADTSGPVGSHTHLRDCSEKLQKAFSSSFNHRSDAEGNAIGPDSEECKQRGVVYIVVSSFKLYFKMGNLRPCKNLVSAVESQRGRAPALLECGYIPKADVVTFRFYKGRLCVYEDKYTEAMKELDFALQHCASGAYNNKRRILSYLIPLKICHGALPSQSLLDKYKFVEFKEITAAVRSGNIGQFNTALQTFLDIFIRMGTYLVLEKAKSLLHRNLIKLVIRLEGGGSLLKLEKVEAAFHMVGESMSLDEIECIIANLIYNQYIKGYISHEKRTLVLSKNDPFPFASVKSMRGS